MIHLPRLLLTGGTGFLGKAVLRRALASGWQVAVLTRSSKPASLPPGVLAIGSGLAAPDWSAIKDFRPDVCVHCAWIATPGEYVHSPINAQLANATIDFASRVQGCGLRHFIGIGSCAEYESSSHPLLESDPEAVDQTPYVKAKLQVLRFLETSFKTPFAWLRIFYLYGPGEHPDRFLSSAARTLKAARELTLRRPDDVVDYVHIEDAADAVWHAAQHGYAGIFNVGSGAARSVSSIAESLGNRIGFPDRVHRVEQQTPTRRVANIQKLTATGWRPRRDFDRSLAEIVATS